MLKVRPVFALRFSFTSAGNFTGLSAKHRTPASKLLMPVLFAVCGFSLTGTLRAADATTLESAGIIQVVPKPFDGALRNPLMGLTARELGVHEWGTLTHHYIGWRELESNPDDGVQKIVDYCNTKWRGFPEKNIKVIPRIYLQYPDRPDEWPDGLSVGDYTSPEFIRRLRLFVEKLGKAWDNDPRVAFIELGLFGKWGEHHSPEPTEEMQRVAGEAFARAFPHKRVSVRRAWETFDGFGFGEYWDSFAHWDEMGNNGKLIAEFNRKIGLYQNNYIGGEVAYDWGNWKIQPGESPSLSLSDPTHLAYVLNTVHWLQVTQLRWISDFDRDNTQAREGAERLQRALGYRFVLDRVSYTGTIAKDGRLHVDFTVRDVGSAPFYYKWPVEVSLLDPADHHVVWHDTFKNADVREWQPGRSVIEPTWSTPKGGDLLRATWPDHEITNWSGPVAEHHVAGEFSTALPKGKYILALAILDPAGMQPAVSFATTQYWRGGRHPIGVVGAGGLVGGQLPDDTPFDKQFSDQTLHYEAVIATKQKSSK
jgi:hypothetical protein